MQTIYLKIIVGIYASVLYCMTVLYYISNSDFDIAGEYILPVAGIKFSQYSLVDLKVKR